MNENKALAINEVLPEISAYARAIALIIAAQRAGQLDALDALCEIEGLAEKIRFAADHEIG